MKRRRSRKPRNVYRSQVMQAATLRSWLKWLGGGQDDLDQLYRQTMATTPKAGST
jgi:hypothetical protein